MTWAPSEVQKTIYETLNNDVTLTALLGSGGKIFDFIPNNQSFPYIQLQIKPWEDRGNHTNEGLSAVITVHTFYRSPNRGDKKVQEIQQRIDTLLHNKDLCFDGWNVISFRRQLIDILIEEDSVTLHGVQKYNLLLGEV